MHKSWSISSVAVLIAVAAALSPSPLSISRYPRAKHTVPLSRSAAPALGNFEGNITIGSQTVSVVLDTGSSDIWFMPQDVQCLDVSTLKPISNALCGFNGTRLIPDFSFQEIPNTHLNLSYASTSQLVGTVGYDKVTLGGIEVPMQAIALAKTAAVSYPGNATGIVGLAYASLTSAFPGEDPSTDVRCKNAVGANNTGCNQLKYSPLLSTMFADGLIPPVFSFALSRGAPHAGVMAIGGLPDIHDPRVNVSKESVQVTVPIEKLKSTQQFSTFFTSIDGFHYADAPTEAGKAQYVVDTGTIPTIIDKQHAEDIGKLFDPPVWYNETIASYMVQCNAVAPELAVGIAGQIFRYNPKDLILYGGDQWPHCMSGVQGSLAAGALPILGSVFLRSVLAVFDVGKGQMTFASRVHYEE